MLFAKTNNNESTKEEFNNISIQDINVNTMNGTIDTVGVNIPCTVHLILILFSNTLTTTLIQQIILVTCSMLIMILN